MSHVDILREARLFAECTEEDLARLDALVDDCEVNDRDLVFKQGDPARELTLVTSGEVGLELPVSVQGQCRNMHFETVKRGGVLGWSALVPPYRYTLSARAHGRAALANLSASKLTILFDAEPLLGFRIMRHLAELVARRLEHTRSMWIGEIQRNLEERYQ